MPENACSERPRTPEEWLEVYNTQCPALKADDLRNGVTQHLDANGMVYQRVSLDAIRSDAPRYAYPFASLRFDHFASGLYSKAAQNAIQTILTRCKRYVERIDEIIEHHGGIGMYLSGKTRGSGKTFLMSIVGAELIRRGKDVLWYSLPTLLQEIKSTYDKDSGTSESEAIRRVQRAPILILDDIGVEKQSSWVNEALYCVLDQRMMHKRPTMFTSNLRPDELKYDERIIDRINRMTTEIQMPEESVRMRLAKYAEKDALAFLDAE